MTRQPVHTRQATLADLDALAPLFDAYRQFYGRPGDLEAARAFLLARFEHGESTVFLAEVDGEPAGFAQLYPGFSSVGLARTFLLNDLFVAPDRRRRGVASGLLRAAEAYARRLSAARLTLSTALDNTAAQTLYAALGWQRDAHFQVYHLALAGA
ncbi:GNAT family N-acetyltransferase [Acidihalobacter prosperus]|uniref:Acetyltransferase n=1 Tax=Acidihalobacter prosperus TaxID=160660 RepID=A0A1A6C4H5_9GAMM|nr:GNAT family N-acetyltransferase [Acidihalobacter prosperus]OBS09463.1 acetyltransferase [Acidihalobacter prosperus]